jgi:hypothetical protein
MDMKSFLHKLRKLTWLRKYWFHILVWVAMVIYVVIAPSAYARFILRDGKPVSLDLVLPANTAKMMYSVDRLDPIIFHGQNLYTLWGWAFIPGEADQSIYERFIVLRSDTKTYFFPVVNSTRPDVQSAFANLHLDLLNSGFTTYLAKDDIPRGSYRVGILFRHKASSLLKYLDTNSIIIRTANQLQLVK